ncbi:hypothetical protein ACPW96_02945 [Micromonospora sp. DT81.3]|uniref:hypothetical protein n=1 Tax=Micromonospora sp. DT81.3 TaxID=3416523 RepID=UPI003CE746F3
MSPQSAPRDLRGIEGLDSLLDRRPFSGRAPEDIPRVLTDVLGVPTIPAATPVEELGGWTRNGVDGALLRWSTGFGPDTEAFLLRPSGETGPLPGIVALHCHGGMKRYGKEKIADGPDAVSAQIQAFRDECYSGRAVANEFALAGNVVLVHDAFGWGSRRVPVENMPWRSEHIAGLELDERRRAGEPLNEAREYDLHAGPHEDVMAKTLGVLGTSWGGVIVRDDLIAAQILAARPEVRDGGVTVAGLSGGGARAVLATALSDDIRAAAVIAMMSTMDAMLDGYLHSHT